MPEPLGCTALAQRRPVRCQHERVPGLRTVHGRTCLVQRNRQVLARVVHRGVQQKEHGTLHYLGDLRAPFMSSSSEQRHWSAREQLQTRLGSIRRACTRKEGDAGARRTCLWQAMCASVIDGPVAYQPTTSRVLKTCLSAGTRAESARAVAERKRQWLSTGTLAVHSLGCQVRAPHIAAPTPRTLLLLF